MKSPVLPTIRGADEALADDDAVDAESASVFEALADEGVRVDATTVEPTADEGLELEPVPAGEHALAKSSAIAR
ncbi:MAG: hypothetical protein U0271_27465 [Polyangiaceae bacterium]